MKCLSRAVTMVLAICCFAFFTSKAAAQGSSGACCLPNGTCATLDKCSCDIQGGAFQGVGSNCLPAPNACTQATFGACCSAAGCAVGPQVSCTISGGTYFAGLTCAGTTCVGLNAGCCCPSVCVFTDTRFCTAMGGTIVTSCSPNPCPQPVCCDPITGACSILPLGTPCNGIPITSSTLCSPNPCGRICCDQLAGCVFIGFNAPCNGLVLATASSCTPVNPCPPPFNNIICCVNGICSSLPAGVACTGTIITTATSCNPNPCNPTGACCVPCATTAAAACIITTAANCPGMGLFNPGVACVTSTGTLTCPVGTPYFGHCCLNGNCVQASSCDCIYKGGSFYGPTSCTAAQCAMDLPGACCNANTGVCSSVSAGTCAALGAPWFHSPGQPCSVTPACQNTGAGRACCCCNYCKILPAAVCLLAGGTVPTTTTCSPNNPCQQITGACCTQNTTGQAAICNAPVSQANCIASGGIFIASGSCTPTNICIIACCDPATGICTNIFGAAACPTGQTTVVGSTCVAATCPQPKVCCDPATGACQTLVAAVGCPPGWISQVGICNPNPCPGVYVCCTQTATGVVCNLIPLGTPCTGQSFPSLSSCSPNPCLPTGAGACCGPNGCVISTSICDCYTTIGGPFFPNTPCNPNLCPTTGQVNGACCIANSAGTFTCIQTTSGNCTAIANSLSTPPPPFTFTAGGLCTAAGACGLAQTKVACCCPNNTCSFIDPAICNLAGGTQIPGATACNPVICTPGSGACCNPATNTCTLVSGPAACPATSIFYPGAVSCVGITCPPPNGACCTPCIGTCVTALNAASCPGLGNFLPGQTCLPNNPCPGPTTNPPYIAGTCCFAPNCVFSTYICECIIKGGAWTGPGGACTPATCVNEVRGSCCNTNTLICTPVASPLTCTQVGGVYSTLACNPVTCGNPGAPCCCCGACHVIDPLICNLAGGTSGPVGTACTILSCAPNQGACCNPATGVCTDSQTVNQCPAPSIFYLQQLCSAVPSCAQTGSCCDCLTGACTVVPQTQCLAPNTYNAGQPCPTPTGGTPGCPITCGSCCNPATNQCFIVASSTACLPPNIFLGIGQACPPPVIPCNPQFQIVCCNPNTGACSVVTVTPGTGCPQPLFQSTASACAPTNPCPHPGACCIPGTTNCFVTVQAFCVNSGGVWFANSSCNPNPCYAACCDPLGSGGCVQIFASTTCPGNPQWIFQGLGTTCSFVFCPVAIAQACCNITTGACIVVPSTIPCPTGTIPYGGGCTFTQCPAVGPCCIPGAACFITVAANCTNGFWGPAGGSCATVPCKGACCNTSTGQCTITVQVNCPAPNIYIGGSSCQPNACPGACCNPATGLCSVVAASACPTPNIFNGNGTTCNAAVQCKPGVCCNANGVCAVVSSPSSCLINSYFLPGITSCLPYPCRGACCLASGVCILLPPTLCPSSAQWMGPYTTCTFSPCPGACCVGGSCFSVPSFACIFATGTVFTFLPGQSCVPSPCLGACCLPPNTTAYGSVTGTHCVITLPTACNGNFKGVGTACFSGAPTNYTSCCPANVNGTGGVNVADIFAFLGAWFNGCTGAPGPPCNGINANFNGVGGVNVADIFAFLGAWFTNCS